MTATTPRPTRKRTDTRQALLSAARALILERGVDVLRVSDITDRAGVGLGSFYNHFSTKDAVVEAVAAETMSSLIASIDALGEQMTDPAEATSGAIRWVVDLGTTMPDFSRLLLRLEDSAPTLERLIAPRATGYFERGRASGRFAISDTRLAIRLTVAGIVAALRSVDAGESGPETGVVAAQSTLLSLGVDRAEAARISSLRLPELPGDSWIPALDQTTVDQRAADAAARPSGPQLRESVSGGVMTLELNRPEALNALNRPMAQGLRDALARAAADQSVRCVVLTGTGRGFCSGWDVANPGPDDDGILEDLLHPLIRDLRALPKPVISVVRGGAVGYGCALAIAADLVVAGESAYFLLAFAKIGLSGDGGVTATLPARVGLGRATRMMMLAERVPGPDAFACGLADYLVADSDLDATAAELAGRFAGGPTRSYRATKQLLSHAVLQDLDAQLDRERELSDELVTTHDYAEGLRSFAERRPPRFTGH